MIEKITNLPYEMAEKTDAGAVPIFRAVDALYPDNIGIIVMVLNEGPEPNDLLLKLSNSQATDLPLRFRDIADQLEGRMDDILGPDKEAI